MDVTPPGAAGTASRPSRTTPSRIPLVLRRVAIGLAGAALALLAGVACALSFGDLRALAVSGRAEPRLAYLYPAAFDVLLVVALVSVPLLRSARFLVRLQAGFVLLLLLASAAAADAATAVGVTFDTDAAALVVALLPWAMLAIGLWLLLILLKHVRTNRADLDGDSDDGLLPFDGERESSRPATAPYPAAVSYPLAEQERDTPAPVVTEERGAPPLQPVPEAVAPSGYVPPLPVSPVSETVAPPEYAPPLPATPPKGDDDSGSPAVTPDTDEDGVRLPPEAVADPASGPAPRTGSAPDTEPDAEPETEPHRAPEAAEDEPEVLPVVEPTAAPHTPPVTEPPLAEPARQTAETVAEKTDDAQARDDARNDGHAAAQEPVAAGTSPETPDASPARPAQAQEASEQPEQPSRGRPLRWGDLVRPHTGDVLVHPRPKPDDPRKPERPEDEAGVDTQPLRQIRDVPDPEHTDAAEPEERDGGHRPHTSEGDDQAALEHSEAGTGDGTVPLAPPSGRMRSTPRPPA